MEKLRQFEFLTLAIKIPFLLDFCTDVLLKFCFDGALYKYACFPNGLASAPRIFTKLLKPAYAILRSMGHLNSGYIDDSYLQGDTSAECHKNVTNTITLFTKLGFQIHPEKSVFIPSQKLTFLGFVVDSNAMTVTLTEEKVLGILSVCASLLKTQMPTIRQVAEVIGILVSNFPGAQYRPLHYRHLEWDKYLALVANKGNYGGGKCNYPLPLSQNLSGGVIMPKLSNKISNTPTPALQFSQMHQHWAGELFWHSKKWGGDGSLRKPNTTSTYWNYWQPFLRQSVFVAI